MKKKLIIGGAILLIVAIAIGIFVFINSNGNGIYYDEQLKLAYKYLEEGNYEEAILAFTKAIEIEPNRTEAYLGRAEAYIGSGETEENLKLAFADYEKVISLDETNAEGYLGMADIYIRCGEFDNALEILKNVFEKTDNNAKITDKIKEIESGCIVDSTDKIRKNTYSFYESDGTLLKEYYYLYEYDENGKLESRSMYRDDTLIERYSYEYKENGNVKRLFYTVYEKNRGYEGFSEYEYNSDNLISAVYVHEKNNDDGYSLKYGDLYEYNENRDVVKADLRYFGNSDITYSDESMIYKYDSSGNLIEEILYAYGGIGRTVSLEYDSQNRLVNVHNRYSGGGEYIEMYEYDIAGEKVRCHFGANDTMLYVEYYPEEKNEFGMIQYNLFMSTFYDYIGFGG